MKQPNKKKLKKQAGDKAKSLIMSNIKDQIRRASGRKSPDLPHGFAKQHVPRKWSVSGSIDISGDRSKKRQLKKIRKWQQD